MPITPAHQWHETETWVSIDVKIPNVTTSSADIITTECYVKVNSAPYFFEADLHGEVDSKMSKAIVGSGTIKFFLVKKEQGLWERLSMLGDRDSRLKRRQRSMEGIRKEREKLRKEYPGKFSKLGRVAVGEQLRMEEVKRKIIEDRKEAENFMEQENIESWKEDLPNVSTRHDEHDDLRAPPLQEIWGTPSSNDSTVASKSGGSGVQFTPNKEKTIDQNSTSPIGRSIPKDLGTFQNIRESSKAKNENGCLPTIRGSQICDEGSDREETFQTMAPPPSTSNANGGNVGGLRYTGLTLPAPRNCSTVPVTFSPKPDLPNHLPARESRDREIKLKKSQKASEDALDVSERAPLFLQDKGDKFFKSGDYQSAVNAYSDALATDPSLVISIANRAACKLHLKDYKACLQDCTSALCILTKGTPDHTQETILAQNLLVQEKMLADHSLIPPDDGHPPSTSGDVIKDDVVRNSLNETPGIRFPVESLELLMCLNGEGCCSMRGVTVEGAGVEEWKLGIKKHMLIRRAVARYHIGDLSRSIDDFAKAVRIKPKNEEVERILEELKMASVGTIGSNE